MLINKSNYEAYALDYIEGNLQGAQLKAMNAFLHAHPTVAAEIEMLRSDFVQLEVDEHIFYDHKESLIKEVEADIVPLRRRVIYRWAVAATIAMLLLGFGAGYFVGNQNSGMNSIATTIPLEENKEKTNEVVLPSAQSVAAVENNSDKNHAKKKMVEEEPKNAIAKSDQPLATEQPKQLIEKAELPNPKMNKITEEEALAMEENIEDETQITLPIVKETINPVATLEQLPKTPLTKLPTTTEDTLVIILDTERLASNDNVFEKVGKLRQFVGRLPFEDATLKQFVPSYFGGE